MVDLTVEQLITEVETKIYQVAGVATQVYAQDNIISKIQESFFVLAQDPDKKWKRFRSYGIYTLDGTTGRATTLIKDTFKEYDHISAVYPKDADLPLTAFTLNQNPTRLSGTYPQNLVADSIDCVKIVPATATGDIVVVGSIFPATPFTLETVVPFDYIALSNFVAFLYMSDDGSSPQAAERLRQTFEARYEHLRKMQDQAPVAINGRGALDYPRQWYV